MPRYGRAGSASASGSSTATAAASTPVIGHRPSGDELIELRDECPDVLDDELQRPLLVLPDVEDQRVRREIDRVHVRPEGGVDAPAQRLEEQAKVVVQE